MVSGRARVAVRRGFGKVRRGFRKVVSATTAALVAATVLVLGLGSPASAAGLCATEPGQRPGEHHIFLGGKARGAVGGDDAGGLDPGHDQDQKRQDGREQSVLRQGVDQAETPGEAEQNKIGEARPREQRGRRRS